MNESPLCRKCGSGTSVVTAYLLTCRHCKRHWHHSCLEPKMSDTELTSILRMLAKRERQETDVWACRRCFLRNGGKGTVNEVPKIEGSENVQPPSVSTSSTMHRQNYQPATCAARKVVPVEILSDDEDIIVIDGLKISQTTATRSTSTGTISAPLNTLPSLLRVKRNESLGKDDRGEEQDEWDDIFEHYSHIRALKVEQKSGLLRSRKPPAAIVRRLGPKARAKRCQETVQWVCPLAEARKQGQTDISRAKREMPSWML